MSEGYFLHEDCPLKHHIRTHAWLPLCRKRRKLIREAGTKKARERRLRYFTFCAVGAVDVLMLDVEKVLGPSDAGMFDTVTFFDRSEAHVHHTLKNIPGANGFPGDFVDIVLLEDPDETNGADELAALDAGVDLEDTLDTHTKQKQTAQRRRFVQQFPFDVINLDLEEFLFRPTQPPPGRLIRALRKVFEWQRRPLIIHRSQKRIATAPLNGFSLMFTTQIGPPDFSDDYATMLTKTLEDNLQRDGTLRDTLVRRTGYDNPVALKDSNFEQFFKIATPKLILEELIDSDWYIDPEQGISLYEIERECEGGTYRILHILMDVLRQHPARDNRRPRTIAETARQAYERVVHGVFARDATPVTQDSIEREKLGHQLNLIKARRKKYRGEDN